MGWCGLVWQRMVEESLWKKIVQIQYAKSLCVILLIFSLCSCCLWKKFNRKKPHIDSIHQQYFSQLQLYSSSTLRLVAKTYSKRSTIKRMGFLKLLANLLCGYRNRSKGHRNMVENNCFLCSYMVTDKIVVIHKRSCMGSLEYLKI